jgi:hypothetical protein
MALADGRAILTLNRKDFVQLHAKQSLDRGIVVCTFDPDFEGEAHRIHDALKLLPQLTGQLVRVSSCESPIGLEELGDIKSAESTILFRSICKSASGIWVTKRGTFRSRNVQPTKLSRFPSILN